MNDLKLLLPHSKKEAKLDPKEKLFALNDLCDLSNCNNCLFFEQRKKDMYLWISKIPNGPSVRFLVTNVHTMAELKLTGNCLRGSRHLLSFDKTFDSAPQYRLLKELFVHVFGVPKGQRRSKPFIDHIFMFAILDNHVWFRNYQIIVKEKEKEEKTLVEIGPRFVLDIIKIFSGSFAGVTLFENKEYVSPGQRKMLLSKQMAVKHADKILAKKERSKLNVEMKLPVDELADVFGQK